MSFRNVQQNNTASKTLSAGTYIAGNWVRNPSWLSLSSISSSDQKFTGLYQINQYANFIAITFATSGGANYTVDWGDGSAPVSVASGVAAYYEYTYSAAGLANTDAPVTFTASSSTVNRNNHGYKNGMNISFATIVTTTGITATQTYYVVNATTNTFQVSNTVGGSAITLTNDGSGTILPYKQAVVTVTPSSGNLITANLNTKHNQSGLVNNYTAPWLDVAFAGSYTTLTCQGQLNNVSLYALQQVNILSSQLTSYSGLLNGLYSLSNVISINSSATVTNSSSMFAFCPALQTVPLFDTSSVTDMSTMFAFSTALVTIPPFNTSNVTTMTSMFRSCTALTTIPLLNTVNVTTISNMFRACYSLRNVPLLNFSNVTTTSTSGGGPFYQCFSLQTVPLFDLSKATNIEGMFYQCYSLKSIPQFNTSNCTSMITTFQNCSSLQTIPLLDTSKVTLMNSMFSGCSSLQSIPTLNTSNVTDMSSMFNLCYSLQTIPLLDTSKVTTLSGTFTGCQSLTSIPAINTANCTNFGSTFNGLTSLQSISINCRASTGITVTFGSAFSSIIYSKAITGCDVSSQKLSGTALNNLYGNLGNVGGSVTFTDSGDLVTINNNGYVDGDTIRFSVITTTTGISTNTTYYVRNPTTNTFQLSSTPTGSIINLVNNGTGTRAPATITVTGNYGTTTDDPTIATGKGWTVTGS